MKRIFAAMRACILPVLEVAFIATLSAVIASVVATALVVGMFLGQSGTLVPWLPQWDVSAKQCRERLMVPPAPRVMLFHRERSGA